MMFRRTVEEDESGSDWDDLSSKDSVRASLTPNGVSASLPKGISTSPQDQKVKSKVVIREKLFPRPDHGITNEPSTSSRGIEGQPQIAVELSSHAPTMDLTSASHSDSVPHPIAVHSSSRVSHQGNSEPMGTAGKGASPAQPYFTNNQASVHTPNSDRSPNLNVMHNGAVSHQLQHTNINPAFPATDRSHDQPTDRSHDHHASHPPTDIPLTHVAFPPTNRSRDHHSAYEVRQTVGRGGGRGQEEAVTHVARLEETGDDEESNAFGIPEEMNMAITEDVKLKKSVRLDLEFSSVSIEKTDSMAATRHPPQAYMAGVADRWEKLSARGVEEACSLLRLVTDLIIAVLLGSAYCLLHHVLRKLLCGLGHLFADSIYKPALSLCFNGFMWPCLQLCSQLSKALVLVIKPLLEVLGVIFSWTAHVCRAIRLVSLTYKSQPVHPHTSGAIVTH